VTRLVDFQALFLPLDAAAARNICAAGPITTARHDSEVRIPGFSRLRYRHVFDTKTANHGFGMAPVEPI